MSWIVHSVENQIMSAESSRSCKVAVLSGDASMLALSNDLARESKCSVVQVDALPELALFFRDSAAEVAGVILDLRHPGPLQKNPATVVRDSLELKAQNKAVPFLIVISDPGAALHFGDPTGLPAGFAIATQSPVMELAAIVAASFKTFSERVGQIEEKLLLERAFIEESLALLDESEPLVLRLEENPGDMDALNTVFRNIHTIKGSSGFFDQNPIPEFLHHFEDVLSKMKAGKMPVTQTSTTVMLKGIDVTRQMLGALQDHVSWAGDVADAVRMFDFPSQGGVAQAVTPAADAVGEPAREIDDSRGDPKVDAKADSKAREAIQVPVQMLDEFMELSGEITVIRNMVNKLVRAIEKEAPGNRNVSLLGELLDEMHKINSSVQGRLTELRKVPAGRILKTLPRAVRDMSKSLGKQIDLKIEGESLRLDTAVAQILGESLVHLVRNAVDHGIELPDVRVARGKSTGGTLEVSLHEEGDEIIATVKDDGGGIDPAKIRQKLVSSGKVSESEVMSWAESRLLAQIFESGFSTASQVTGISGRGVGMDMVKNSVEKLRGRIDIESKVNSGTTFILRLPIPKSVLIVSSLLVQASGKAFAVPQDRIVRLLRVADARAQGMVRSVEGGMVIDFHGELIPVLDLGVVLGLRESMPDLNSNIADMASFIVIQAEGGIYACHVDAILDSEEIVMKKVGAQLEGRKAFSGATFMGDGTVGLILNVDGIAELGRVHLSYADLKKPARTLQTIRKNDILLVDVEVPGDFGVPMDSVYRLEDFEAVQVKQSIDRSVVVYRDQAMPLVDLSLIIKAGAEGSFRPAPVSMEDRERAFVLVFRTRMGQFFGCVVDRIKDFISLEEDLRPTNRSYECIKGSVIIDSRIISVLDPEVIVDVASRAFDRPAPAGLVAPGSGERLSA